MIEINSVVLLGKVKTTPKVEDIEMNFNNTNNSDNKIAKKTTFTLQFSSQGSIPDSEIQVSTWGKNAEIAEGLNAGDKIGIMGILRCFMSSSHEDKKIVEILAKSIYKERE